MNETKRTKSISRRINRRNILNMLSSFILIDIIILSLSFFFWCYNAEVSPDSKFQLSAQRYFTSIENVPEKTEELLKNKISTKGFVFPEDFKEILSESVYVHENTNGKLEYTYSGSFLLGISSIMNLLLLIQIICILETALMGARKIRRDLAPLDEIAFKAKVLGNTADFDPQTFYELEKAINEISPVKEGAKLHTGNAELEQLEISINNLLERMRDSYRQQSRFVSDASHELRTPLAVLQGYVNMLDRWGKTDEKILNESIDAIKSETEHMKKLVEQLLFLARGDSGKTKLNMQSFSLNEMMKEVYEESSMIDKNHIYSFTEENNEITAYGDISMLKQTARILIDNASKYTPENSSILLKIKTSNEGSPSFIIQDEGIGISSKDVSHMFERFFRSDPARTKDSGGAGLGLSIAKWIIDRHGGYFDVISREDIGTRITVTLPKE